TPLLSPKYRLCLVYDEEMAKHRSIFEKEHPERPERTQKIWECLSEFGILERSFILMSRRATRQEVERVHCTKHTDFMFGLEKLRDDEILNHQDTYKSVYLCPSSNDSALLSAGSLLQVFGLYVMNIACIL
ncbi:hypothetical protein SK128_017961, partial [Halocaridina rubra]